jgi:hypothetical protein
MEDELLLVNSYLNSRNTLTTLPGPYRSINDIQKLFKLRFSNTNLEEDVHVFPTSPPSRFNPPSEPRGILKGAARLVPSGSEGEHAQGHADSSGARGNKFGAKFLSVPSSTVKNAANRPSSAAQQAVLSSSSRLNGGDEGSWQVPVPIRPKGSSDDFASGMPEGDGSNGRGGQHPPFSSSPRSCDISAPSDRDLYSFVGMGEVRASQTAEDRLKLIMRDMRVSHVSSEDKASRGSMEGRSRGFKDYGSKDGDSSEQEGPHRAGAGVDAADEKSKYSYNGHESLSLYDLAALPLEGAVGRDSKHSYYGEGANEEDLQSQRNRIERREKDIRRAEPGRSAARPSPSGSDRGQTSQPEEGRERETAYQLYRARRRESERESDPLSAFQQQGQEAAVRVRYTTAALSAAASIPNRGVRNAWQEEDPHRAYGDRPAPYASSRGAAGAGLSNQSVDTRGSDRLSVTSLQSREKERDKAVRTYRYPATPDSC